MGFFADIFGADLAANLYAASATPYEQLLAAAVSNARDICSAAERRHGVGNEDSWAYDQDSGFLTLDFGDHSVKGQAEIIGTFSKDSSSWLWAWANQSIDPRLCVGASSTRDFGEHNGFDDLVMGQWEAQEGDGWLMSAVTLHVASGQGLYSGDFGAGRVYFLVRSFEL